jgi:hypothetical protein
MKIYPSAEEELAPCQSPVQKAPALSRFSCFSDVGCLESAEETVPARGTPATYTTLEESLDSDTVYLQTRKPVWNREIKHWVHNFGGRVRIPSNKNFLVVQSTAAEHYNVVQYIGNVAQRSVSSATDAQVSDRVCIRHGQVCHLLYCLSEPLLTTSEDPVCCPVAYVKHVHFGLQSARQSDRRVRCHVRHPRSQASG